MKSLLLSAFLLPSVLLHAQSTPENSAPQNTPAQAVPAACPLRADEVHMDPAFSGEPGEDTNDKRYLHVTLVNASGKLIVSYVLHARFGVFSKNLTLNRPSSTVVTEKWRGNLEPDTPKKEHWAFPADRLSMDLRSVWFDKVAYADGTVWTKKPNDGCVYPATAHIVQTETHPGLQTGSGKPK